jgi:hypothetical protein
MIDYGNEKLNEIFDLTWPNLNRTMQPYPDEMFEEAERREKENQVLQIAKDLIDQHGDAMTALAEIEKNELIDRAIEELGWIVAGGQDGEEFYNSINFIKRVLERCKQ